MLRLTIRLEWGPIISINDTFWISQGSQLWPVGELLSGLGRPQPISGALYERLKISWLAFQCLMYYQILQEENKMEAINISSQNI
jgi:hypothetical protein